MKKIGIIGAGGHARVIADALSNSSEYELAGFFDDSIAIGSPVFGDVKVLGTIADFTSKKSQLDAFIIGIGDNVLRKKIVAEAIGVEWVAIIHPQSIIASNARIEQGAVILAGAVINSNSRIGKHSIINSNVVVDHDCQVGEFTHLAIGTLLGSNSQVPDSFKTQIGQVIPVFTAL
jgi:acetyltransferase EpsM